MNKSPSLLFVRLHSVPPRATRGDLCWQCCCLPACRRWMLAPFCACVGAAPCRTWVCFGSASRNLQAWGFIKEFMQKQLADCKFSKAVGAARRPASRLPAAAAGQGSSRLQPCWPASQQSAAPSASSTTVESQPRRAVSSYLLPAAAPVRAAAAGGRFSQQRCQQQGGGSHQAAQLAQSSATDNGALGDCKDRKGGGAGQRAGRFRAAAWEWAQMHGAMHVVPAPAGAGPSSMPPPPHTNSAMPALLTQQRCSR